MPGTCCAVTSGKRSPTIQYLVYFVFEPWLCIVAQG
jgi:hypothetical protein